MSHFETHVPNLTCGVPLMCHECVCTCVHVQARVWRKEMSKDRTNGSHPYLIRDNEGESVSVAAKTMAREILVT